MVRLIFVILLFLISLLAVFNAPAYYLWLLAVVVTDFPWFFASLSLLVLISGFLVDKYRIAITIFGVAALILFISPTLRAYKISNNLKKDLTTNLGPGNEDDKTSPFSFWNMFAGKAKIPYFTTTYITYSDISLSLDYYPSKTAGKRPCIIVVHGGSWSSGDSRQLPDLNSYLAKKGYNVASINYRLAPKYLTPAPVEDVKNALVYLHKHADKLNIDTNKFVLLGRSAGAQIALLAAYTLHDKAIKGVIDFYGPADMVWGYSVPSNPLVMDSRGVMEKYIGGAYAQMPQRYAACSPIEFVNRQSPPTLIIHGKNDVLVAYEHSRRLNEKLQQNWVKHFWLKLPWATHGFDFNMNGPGGQLSTYAVEYFLNKVTE